MKLNDLQAFFAHSPALRLLRAPHGALILAFFHRAFKQESRIVLGQDLLLAELADFQEVVGKDALPLPPQDYLSHWCKAEVRYLHRFFQGHSGEPVYQLTSSTESALRFVQECLEQENHAVGAESCVHLIAETLQDLAVHGLGDATQQIALLEAEQHAIQQKIHRIRSTGKAEVEDPSRSRERFSLAMALLRRITSDFRQVEDKFKAITREVQDLQGSGTSKGGLLGYVLDAESLLKDSDQGRSFYGFVHLILSPARQEELRRTIDQVLAIDALAHQQEDRETLLGMIPNLTAEAEQVMQTIQRLSASLHRILDGRLAGERRQIALTIDEILQQARRRRNQPPGELGLAIESEFRVFSPFSRIFWSPATGIEAAELQVAAPAEQDMDEAFEILAQMQRLDWQAMREAVRECTSREPSVSLPRLLHHRPPRSGAVEVLAYVQIAEEGDHLVDPADEDEILLPPDAAGTPRRALRLPRVLFRQEDRERGERSWEPAL